MVLPHTPLRRTAQLDASSSWRRRWFRRASAAKKHSSQSSFMACSILSRQVRVCGMPLAGSPFFVKVQRRQPAVRSHFRRSSMWMFSCLGAYSRRAGTAGSGSPGPGKTTVTATSKAAAGLAQRVARTVSIASRSRPSALGTLHRSAFNDLVVERDKVSGSAPPSAHPYASLPPGLRNDAVILQSGITPEDELTKFERDGKSPTNSTSQHKKNGVINGDEVLTKKSFEDLDPVLKRHRWTHARGPLDGWKSHLRPNVTELCRSAPPLRFHHPLSAQFPNSRIHLAAASIASSHFTHLDSTIFERDCLKCTTCQQSKPHQRNRFFSRGHDPYTHACKARPPSTDVGLL